MPGPCILKINEIFASFQGEGSHQGRAALFIRLAGCSVGCSYCDTRDAWSTGTEKPVADILDALQAHRLSFPQALVVLTGGEPLEQDLTALVAGLKEQGFYVAIETHGALFQPLPLDWWTVSPKDVTGYTLHPHLIPFINEIKLIVNANLTVAVVQTLRHRVPAVPFFLQPNATHPNRYQETFTLFKQCQAAGLVDIRCGLQLHRIYDVQ